MTKMTGKLRQRMLESFEKSMAQVFAGGLRVVAERINGKSVVSYGDASNSASAAAAPEKKK